MKRIGYSVDGGQLLDMTADEVRAIESALVVLRAIVGDVPAITAPPRPLANPPKVKPAKVAADHAAAKSCKHCGKPVVGVKGRQCKDCLNAKARAKYEPATKRAQVAKAKQSSAARFAPKDHKLSGRVTRDTAPAVRERDPQLDRPVTHGRVEPVGAQE